MERVKIFVLKSKIIRFPFIYQYLFFISPSLPQTTVPHLPVTFENPGYGGAAGGADPEKDIPKEFADVLPEKVDVYDPNFDTSGGNPYTNMPIGGVDPYNQMVGMPPPEPPPAYSASAEKLDEI